MAGGIGRNRRLADVSPVSADITIVIPTFRRPEHLARAVRSAFASTPPVDAIIVVDDGGGVELPALPATCLVVAQPHRGVSAARNLGVELAATEFVYFLDDDDELQAGALAHLHDLATRRTADIVHGRWRTVDSAGAVVREPLTGTESAGAEHLLFRSLAPLSACLFRTTALRAVGGFDDQLLALEDWDLFVRLVANDAQCEFLDEVVAVYVDHAGSLSKQWAVVLNSARVVVRNSLPRLCALDTATTDALEQLVIAETARRAALAGEPEVSRSLAAMLGEHPFVASDLEGIGTSSLLSVLTDAVRERREEIRRACSSMN